jgi:hypothetical protein
MDKQQLLDEVRAGRDRLEFALASLTDEQMDEQVNGEWTRTDVLAHLEAWERRTNRLFSIVRGERDFDPDEPGDVDEFNAWSYERNRGRALAEVRASERQTFADVLELVELADEGELSDPTRFPFLDGRPFSRTVLENTSEHYDDHLAHLAAVGG